GKRMREAGAHNARGVVTDCNPLPLDSGFASRIIAMEVLEHVADPQIILAELARVGRPGALYLISVPDGAAEKMQIPFAPSSTSVRPTISAYSNPASWRNASVMPAWRWSSNPVTASS